MELRLYTLSPLHIGTGETLSPMDYVVHNKTFYRLEQRELYKLVGQLPNGIRAFGDWIADQFDEMRSLNNNYEQSRLSNDTNALTFFKEQKQEKVLLDYLRQQGGQPLILDDDHRQNRGRGMRLGEVREAARTDERVYLPGTSLKGAIRTALLYDYLQRHGDIGQIERMIRERLKDRRTRKEYFADPLEAEAFFCRMIEKNKSRPQEAQMDMLKWLSVSDAYLKGEQLAPAVGKINLYLIEKEQTKDRNRTPRLLASRQPQASYAEMIPEGQELFTQLRFDGTTLAFLLEKAGAGSIDVSDHKYTNRYYQDLRTKVQRLFHLSKDQLDRRDPAELAAAVVQHCQNALDRFSRAQLQRQKSWQEDYAAQVDRENFAPRIAAGFEPVEHYQGKLLHLGYAAGFQATTVLLYFLEDRGKASLFERVMERYQLGRAPRQKGNYTPNIRRFPKSRRFVEAQNVIQPMGWIALLGTDEPTPAIDYPATGKASKASNTTTKTEVTNAPITPEYYTGKLNYRKPPIVDAVVVKSGSPNLVKVYLTPDNSPEMELRAYRNTLDVGTIIKVKVLLTKKGSVDGVNFSGIKK